MLYFSDGPQSFAEQGVFNFLGLMSVRGRINAYSTNTFFTFFSNNFNY